MGLLPRFRDNRGLYCMIAGVAITCLYFLILNLISSPVSVAKPDYNATLKKNYLYDEVCRAWKLELEKQKALEENRRIAQEIAVEEYEGWDDNFDYSTQFRCERKEKRTFLSQRGLYYVIYNFVKAEKEFGCMDSITLSAPGDYRFLDNVVPLVDRWQGPISIALYAPGYDFYTTLDSIAYLTNCETDLIRKFVTFHILFDQEHTPKQRPNGTILLDAYEDYYNCSLPPPWQIVSDEDMYKTNHSLLYPINVARNVAKLAAETYFVFPSDIELYPTRQFIPLFLDFVKDNLDLFESDRRNVFVLPIFEVLENQSVPESKNELLEMLKDKTAIIFHQSVCPVCHTVIDSEKWVKTEETDGLAVFSVGKRTGNYVVWEPFFVCTQKDPLWDERMTWEGQSNKMVQAYTMCIMDYEFHVLDNVFLIHKPGVKKKKVQMEQFNDIVKNSTRLMKNIAIELQELYGYNSNCSTSHPKKPKLPKPSKQKSKNDKEKT